MNKLPLSRDRRGLTGPEKESLRAALQLLLQSHSRISLFVLLKSTDYMNSSNSLLSPLKIIWPFNTTLLTKQKGNHYPWLKTLLQTVWGLLSFSQIACWLNYSMKRGQASFQIWRRKALYFSPFVFPQIQLDRIHPCTQPTQYLCRDNTAVSHTLQFLEECRSFLFLQ